MFLVISSGLLKISCSTIETGASQKSTGVTLARGDNLARSDTLARGDILARSDILARVDSLARSDILARIDSLARSDTLALCHFSMD